MNGHQLRNALHSGTTVFGTLIVSDSPRWPDAIRNCGLDFVFIDTEHIALTRSQVSWMCQTYTNMGLSAIVRIPSPDPYVACSTLDGGATGIIAPYVESAEEAKRLRGALRFRPLKGKKRDRILDGGPIEPELDDYLKKGNDGNVFVVNIESIPAIENLDEILSVPGLDAVLIGPHDLSCSLGIPEQYDHPEFMKACETIFSKARSKNIGAGMHYTGAPEKQAAFVDIGANMLIHSSDLGLFSTHLRTELSEIKRRVGVESDSAGTDQINI